jgi:hypothetical protein
VNEPTAIRVSDTEPKRPVPRFLKLLVGTVVLLAVMALVPRWWPTRIQTDVPFDRVVVEVTALYPLVGTGPIRYSERAQALRHEHPAYEGYPDPLWELEVRHVEVTPGQTYRVTIINAAKFKRRDTTITIQRTPSGTDVTISSQEHEYLPVEYRLTDRHYERERASEIRKRLRRLTALETAS